MSAGSSTHSITEIITSANIVQWYDAEDLSSVGIGNSVATWTDRSSSLDHLTQSTVNSRGLLQQDVDGFKYVDFDYSVFTKEMQSTLTTLNTDETVIMVVERSPFAINGGLRTNFASSLNQCLVTNANVQQSITDAVTGSGRQVLTLNTAGKIIVSFSRRVSSSTIMRLTKGFSLATGTFTNTTFSSASVQRFFRGSAGSAYSVKAYFSITLNQYLDDTTLKSLIRTIAFQKGILV